MLSMSGGLSWPSAPRLAGLDPIVPARSGSLLLTRRCLSLLLSTSLFQERRRSGCLARPLPRQDWGRERAWNIRRDQQRCPGRHLRLGVVCYMPLAEETRGQKAALVSGLFGTVLRASLNAWFLQRYSVVTATPPAGIGQFAPGEKPGDIHAAEAEAGGRLSDPRSQGARFGSARVPLTEFTTCPKSRTRQWTRFQSHQYRSCSPSTLVTPGSGRTIYYPGTTLLPGPVGMLTVPGAGPTATTTRSLSLRAVGVQPSVVDAARGIFLPCGSGCFRGCIACLAGLRSATVV